jgi:tetratricopeptide (TPR) repeat protein
MAKKSKKKSRFKLSRKTVVTTIIIVVVLLVAAGAGILIQTLQRQQSTDQGVEGDANDFTIGGGPSLPKADIDSQNLAVSGKTDEANKKIDEALQKNPDNDTKYELYIQLGLNQQNAGNFSGAMEQYRKAEAIKQDFKIVKLIAQTAEAMGDKVLALEYYRKAIPLIDPENALKDAEKRRLEQKIAELGG